MGRGAVGAARDAHVEAPAGELVRGGEILREPDGVVVGQDTSALPHAQVLRDAGEVHANQNRIGAGDGVAAVPEVVLSQPAGGEAALVQDPGGIGPFTKQLGGPGRARTRGSRRCRRIASGDPGYAPGQPANEGDRLLTRVPEGKAARLDAAAAGRTPDHRTRRPSPWCMLPSAMIRTSGTRALRTPMERQNVSRDAQAARARALRPAPQPAGAAGAAAWMSRGSARALYLFFAASRMSRSRSSAASGASR